MLDILMDKKVKGQIIILKIAKKSSIPNQQVDKFMVAHSNIMVMSNLLNF
jgi:hypothetical protein